MSEIILQQTQVAQGLPYYLRFIETYPTVFNLAKAPQDEVLKLWQGLGYYSRARNLHHTAKYIAEELNGTFPDNYKALLKLKGVGDYTASAIASISFQEPVAVVDGNVYRVLSRYFGIVTAINSTEGVKEFKALAETLLDNDQPALNNQAIMEFGARHCKPSNPLCESCPFNDSCNALQLQKVKDLPVKLKKTKIKKRYLNYVVLISEDQKTMLRQRKGKGIWQGLYEFPFIESKKPLTEIQFIDALKISELHISAEKITLFNDKDVVHKLSHQHLHTKFWIVDVMHISEEAILLKTVHDFPVPVLIQRFLEDASI